MLSPAFAAPLDAQSTPASNSEDILIVTPDTTGSRLGLTPLETPATISVIDAESRAPGISNSGNPGKGGTALAARGSSG